MACLRGCIEGLKALFSPPETEDEEVEYYALMGFLAEVPLFKKQLSPADLPSIARSMQSSTWKPGETVVKQGHPVESFYLVQSGKALVILQDGANSSGKHNVCTELVRGDFFAARALVTRAPMVATICAAGPEPLVTLSLSRSEFERQGLHKKMYFPPRPAIDGRAAEALQQLNDGSPKRSADEDLYPEEEEFVQRAICSNANLHALAAEVKTKATDLATHAVRRRFKEGQEVLKAGAMATGLLVVESGSLEAVKEDSERFCMSAEERVLKKAKLAEQLHRKANIIHALGSATKVMKHKSMFAKKANTVHQLRRLSLRGTAAEGFKVGEQVIVDNLGEAVTPRPPRLESQETRGLGTPRVSGTETPRVSGSEATTETPRGVETPRLAHCASMQTPRLAHCASMQDTSEQVGVVVDVSVSDVITVWVSGQMRRVKPNDLRRKVGNIPSVEGSPVDGGQHSHIVRSGESVGEMSLLYNSHMKETYVAAEDSVVYIIARKYFKQVFHNLGPLKQRDVKEFAELLDEVHMLSPLLRGERQELARNATGRVTFKAGEMALIQGKIREYPQWYIVEKGDCFVHRMVEAAEKGGTPEREDLGRLQRGGHFGERSLLRGDTMCDMSVSAGPCGMTCLAIDGEILRGLNLGGAGECGQFGVQDFNGTASHYEKEKAKHGCYARDSLCIVGRELEMDNLEVVKFLGQGGFGAVTLVRDKVRKDVYALKKMSKGQLAAQGMQRRIVSEREIMARVDSFFLAGFYRSFRDEQYIYFLLEAVLGGDLLQVRRDYREVFEKDNPKGSGVAFYVACITAALEHLHDHQIVYRDLKPENVLLGDRGYAKLCDFGFARFCFRKSYTFLGTPEYMAPEMIDAPHRHDHMVDWWALGVMTYELWAGQTPFGAEDVHSEDPQEQVFAIRRAQSHGMPERLLPRGVPPVARDFMRRLLRISPGSRAGARSGASEVAQHGWFESVGLRYEALKARVVDPPFTPEVLDCSELPALPERPDVPPQFQDGEWKDDSGLFLPYEDDGSAWDRAFC